MVDKFSPMTFLFYISPREHSSLTMKTLNIQQKTYNFVHISPVNSSSSLNLHPIQGKVNLPNKRGHSLHNSVGHTKNYAWLLPHYPIKKKSVIEVLPQNRNGYAQVQHPNATGQTLIQQLVIHTLHYCHNHTTSVIIWPSIGLANLPT